MMTTRRRQTTVARLRAPSARRRTPSPDHRARLVFLGSGAFGVPILEALSADPAIELIAVVSAPDRPAGRSGALTTAISSIAGSADRASRIGTPKAPLPRKTSRARWSGEGVRRLADGALSRATVVCLR